MMALEHDFRVIRNNNLSYSYNGRFDLFALFNVPEMKANIQDRGGGFQKNLYFSFSRRMKKLSNAR